MHGIIKCFCNNNTIFEYNEIDLILQINVADLPSNYTEFSLFGTSMIIKIRHTY